MKKGPALMMFPLNDIISAVARHTAASPRSILLMFI